MEAKCGRWVKEEEIFEVKLEEEPAPAKKPEIVEKQKA